MTAPLPILGTQPLRAVDATKTSAITDALNHALEGGPAVFPFTPESDSVVRRIVEATLGVAEEIALVIRTSGSTADPKAVAITRQSLRASAEATNTYLAGGGQWLCALSPSVIAGAQTVVRSLLAGTEPVFVEGHFDELSFVQAANSMTAARRYTALVPVQLSKLLSAPPPSGILEVLKRFDAILLGGQSTPSELVERATSHGLRLVRTYGSTETASGCVYEGVPIGDTMMTLREGELLISGSCLAAGYLGDETSTSDRFIESGGRRWFRTRDVASIDAGRLQILGRLDNMFISGGSNVSLDAIESCVHGVPGWDRALAVAVDDPTWGQRAVLVIDEQVSGFEEVQARVRDQLGAPAVPLDVRVIDQIPLLASGKPDRTGIEKLF